MSEIASIAGAAIQAVVARDIGEHERWQARIEGQIAFCREIQAAWLEQEIGAVDYGLRADEVMAIIEHGRWLVYDLEKRWWDFDRRTKPAVPEPEAPDCARPAAYAIPRYPDLPRASWCEHVAAYLAYTRRRAGLEVVGTSRFDAFMPYGQETR
jgi:hypothetical protein